MGVQSLSSYCEHALVSPQRRRTAALATVQFPLKKVLLLLWKVLLTSLVCSEELQFYICVQFPM
jgi:hypothetical protein